MNKIIHLDYTLSEKLKPNIRIFLIKPNKFLIASAIMNNNFSFNKY